MLIGGQESQITSTNPNRVTLVSGSVNVPGSPQGSSQGGVYIDNNEMPGISSFGCPLIRCLFKLTLFRLR
jgi:hypothetical protein